MIVRHHLIIPALIAATLSGTATAQNGGDAAAPDFAAYCSEPLPAARQRAFEQNLGLAEQALAKGDLDGAQRAIAEAYSASYRGGPEWDVGVKCLGRATAERWHTARLDLRRRQTASRGGTDLYVIAADRGAAGLVKTVTADRPQRFRSDVYQLKDIVRRLEAERDYGAFLLAEEQAVIAACNDALAELRQWANGAMAEALEAEKVAFNRPVSDQERQMTSGLSDFATAVTGVELAVGIEPEVAVMERRVKESLEKLGEAQQRDLDPPEDSRSAPWSKRARQRGDALYKQAGDSNYSFSGRDALYAHAARYYEFGGWTEEQARVDAARAAIQPELAAEEARLEAEQEKALVEMEKKAEASRRAAEDMMKSEQEQEAFKREADALEEELGF